jgi:hypothetical protein
MWRSLRIAVSAFSLVACVLVCGLWIRSFRHHDYVFIGVGTIHTRINSDSGIINLLILRANSKETGIVFRSRAPDRGAAPAWEPAWGHRIFALSLRTPCGFMFCLLDAPH